MEGFHDYIPYIVAIYIYRESTQLRENRIFSTLGNGFGILDITALHSIDG